MRAEGRRTALLLTLGLFTPPSSRTAAAVGCFLFSFGGAAVRSAVLATKFGGIKERAPLRVGASTGGWEELCAR